jgi:hypothetical protein
MVNPRSVELQVVQTQLILPMLEYSLGKLDRSRDLSIAAFRMVCSAGFNEEAQWQHE